MLFQEVHSERHVQVHSPPMGGTGESIICQLVDDEDAIVKVDKVCYSGVVPVISHNSLSRRSRHSSHSFQS